MVELEIRGGRGGYICTSLRQVFQSHIPFQFSCNPTYSHTMALILDTVIDDG